MDRFIGDIFAEHPDKRFFAMDAEQFQEIAEANEVRGIPSLLVYKNGEKIAHLHSKLAKTPAQIREYLNEIETGHSAVWWIIGIRIPGVLLGCGFFACNGTLTEA